MITLILGLLGKLGLSLLNFATKRSDNALEALKVKAEEGNKTAELAAQVSQSDAAARRDIILAGMQNPWFWRLWVLATLPVVLWFGWGMLDSLFNGGLSDVASLPPQLKEYADASWQSLFYSGAGVKGVEIAANAFVKARSGSVPVARK